MRGSFITFHVEVESVGRRGPRLVGHAALVVSNVLDTEVIDEQSLVQEMNVVLGILLQVLSLKMITRC